MTRSWNVKFCAGAKGPNTRYRTTSGQVDKVGKYVALSCSHQCGGCFGIDDFCEGPRGKAAPGEGFQNSGLARQAVGDQPVKPLSRVGDRSTMAGMECFSIHGPAGDGTRP